MPTATMLLVKQKYYIEIELFAVLVLKHWAREGEAKGSMARDEKWACNLKAAG